MASKIKYPVGIQTFEKIITGNYLYVDKTAQLYELAHNAEYVFLSRPRRFGKSLLMSTLEAYFKGRKELFQGLAIDSLETDWVEYPVFRFDLSGENFNSVERLISKLRSCLLNIEEAYSLQATGNSPAERFKKLIQEAHKKFGKRVVILIDEYDKPMLDCLHESALHEEIKAELRGFYSVIKLSDEHIHFAMLTGVTKFGKVSIFSGLNNLEDISMNPLYNGLCGITETEFRRDFAESVKDFALATGMTEDEVWRESKLEYDGYKFSDIGEYIYNPFSLLSAFKTKKFEHYWYASGSSSYLIKLVKRHRFLLSSLEGARRRASSLNDISDIDRDFVPLLYQAGYLTIKSYNRITKEYTLGFPNREVYEGFWDSLSDYFFRGYGGTTSFDLQLFLTDVEEGRPEEFMKRLSALFADTSSEHEADKEIHFQNMMAIACKMMGLVVRTEIHSSRGRCDMQIETPRFVYIFEFKVDGSAEEALAQIKERGYAEPFRMDHRPIFLIGANFSTETRNLTFPCLIETLTKSGF